MGWVRWFDVAGEAEKEIDGVHGWEVVGRGYSGAARFLGVSASAEGLVTLVSVAIGDVHGGRRHT